MSPESPPEFRHHRLTVSAVLLGLTTIAELWHASPYIAHHQPRVAGIRRALESSRKTLEHKRAAGSPSRTG